MVYAFGDLLLLSLAFSDASASKRRPILVVFDNQDADILAVPITSQAARSSWDVRLKEWRGAGLRLPSPARVAKLTTVARQGVLRRLGYLREPDATETLKVLRLFLREIAETADSAPKHG